MSNNAIMPPTPSSGPSVAFANNAVKNHQNLVQKAPAVAADAISTGNNDTLMGVAATQTIAPHAQALADHINDYGSHSVWASILGGAENVLKNVVNGAKKVPGVGQIMEWAYKPLQEIQRDYKFIHSVYTDHSTWQGTLATLGIAGGAALGSIGGPLGAIAGADIAAAGERALAKLIPGFKDSVAKSEDPNYLVSAGRDVSNLISNIPGFAALKDTQHGWGQTISGVTDAIFDFGTDPLVRAGAINTALKSGKYVGVAVDDAGKTIFKADGFTPAQVKATTPIAAQSESINNFMVSYSGKAVTSEQVRAIYDNPLNTSIRRAVDTIAKTENPIEIQRLFPRSQFTTYEAQRLAKASTPEAVVNEMSKSLYSKELLEKDYAPRNTLIMPTQSLARAFTDKGLQAVRQSGTTLNEQRNLLLPRTSTVVDEAGNPMVNADGSLKKQTLQGGIPVALAKLGMLDLTAAKEASLNALAGKVRTFTGYKALVINSKTLEQSAKNFDWHDANLGPQIYNMLYYTMPHDLALEHTAKIMLEDNLELKQNMYANAVKETVKAAGLGANHELVQKVMSQAQRATTNGELSSINYGPDHTGAPRGYVEMADGSKQGVAVWSWQRGSNAFIDFKELRRAMRETTIHSMLYQRADDFFTFYTDKVFAPLTLFSTGFGLRVASSEALHQIIRAGMGDYLKSQVAQSAAKYNLYGKLTENEIQRFADSAAQALTAEDHLALETGNKVVDNAITKLIAQKAEIYKSLSGTERVNELATDIRDVKNKIRPVGFVTSKIAPYVAKDKLSVISDYQQLMGAGKGVPAGVASDHGSSFNTNAAERVDILSQLIGHTAMPTEELASLTGTNPHYHQYWALNLSKTRNEMMARDMAKDYQKFAKEPGWSELTNDQKWAKVYDSFQKRVADPKQYSDIRPTMVGLREGKPESFANEAVSAFRGMVEGASGKIHDNLIDNIAQGKRTYESDLKEIPTTDSPYAILGKAHKPAWDKPYQRILDVGYRTFVNPIIDHISREPMFAHFLYENFRDLKPMIDAGLSRDSALRIAGQKATVDMVPLIHNPALRSQFATLSRNIMPFYFAQEQAMKRVGRLAYTDGRALKTFRDFQMIHQGINNPGFVHEDSTGKKYIVYPVLGEFGNAAVRAMNAMGIDQYSGMPTSVTGNVTSLMTVLPELKVPGVNPLGNVLLTDLGKRFPWMDQATGFATGGFPATNWLDTVIPNSGIRAIFNGLTMDQRVNVVHNATLNAMSSAYYHGIIDDNFPKLPAAQQQQIIDKIENNAKTNLFLQGFFSFFLPLAPTVANVDMNKELKSLRSEFQDRLQAEQTKGTPDAFAVAKDAFLAEHGDSAISFTVGFTKTKENGASVPLSDITINWLNDHKDIMKTHPNGAAYLIPQNTQGGNIAQIENKLLTMEIRSKQTPQEFVNAVYNQKGWVDLGQDWKDYQAALMQAKQTNNVAAISQISQAWKLITEDYAKQNPIWYSNYKDPTKPIDAQNALKDLTDLASKNKLGNSPQAPGIKSLLSDYSDYHAALAGQTKGTKLTSVGYQILDAWNAYLDQKIIDSPGLTNVINGVFRRVQ